MLATFSRSMAQSTTLEPRLAWAASEPQADPVRSQGAGAGMHCVGSTPATPLPDSQAWALSKQQALCRSTGTPQGTHTSPVRKPELRGREGEQTPQLSPVAPQVHTFDLCPSAAAGREQHTAHSQTTEYTAQGQVHPPQLAPAHCWSPARKDPGLSHWNTEQV